jgi:RNA polymerase sigma-70 factor (ECF subfamily)
LGEIAHLPDVTNLAIADAAANEQTVSLAASGDEAAFTRLIATHHDSMARVAYAVTGDRESAADAVQSAWSIAWQRLGSLRDPLTVRSWLIAIAANEARQIVRRQRTVQVVDISTVEDSGGAADPAEAAAVVDLQRVIRSLEADDRALLALRFVAGFDSTEIAKHLGISAAGVRSRLSRLTARLRQELEHV